MSKRDWSKHNDGHVGMMPASSQALPPTLMPLDTHGM
jgi:hypothetical protein